MQRAVSSWGFVLYVVFCLSTARLLAGNRAEQMARSEQRQDAGVTTELLRTGWGQELLVLAGVLVVAGGVEAGRRAVRLNSGSGSPPSDVRGAGHGHPGPGRVRLGRAGCRVRLDRCLPIKAAVLSRADQAKGLDAVFRSVASSHYGAWLLALLACGLFCYGLYCLVEVRYRDLTPGQ